MRASGRRPLAGRGLMRLAWMIALGVLLMACNPVRPPYGPRSESGETAQVSTVGEVEDLLAKQSIGCDPAGLRLIASAASDSAACSWNGAEYIVNVFDDEGQTRNWLSALSTQGGASNGNCYLLGPRWSLQMSRQDNRFQDALGGTWAEHRGGGCIR